MFAHRPALIVLLYLAGLVACRERPGAPRQQPADRPIQARPAPSASGGDDRKISLLTYNVLADPVHVSRRIPALMWLLEQSRCDVIALQEVAPWFLGRLGRQGWIRHYHVTRFHGRVGAPGGQMILSRFPILATSSHVLPGKQQRTVVIARLRIGRLTVAVATTHMESYLEDGPVRARQLDRIFTLVRDADHAVVLGDLNFGDGEQPETDRLDRRYRDLWLALEPKEPGFTWNNETSDMARRGSFPGEKSRRLDRILVRVKGYAPRSVRIIGDRPVKGSRVIFPSDHFGLVGVIERVAGTSGGKN